MPKQPKSVVVPVQGGSLPTVLLKSSATIACLLLLGMGIAIYARHHRDLLVGADGTVVAPS